MAQKVVEEQDDTVAGAGNQSTAFPEVTVADAAPPLAGDAPSLASSSSSSAILTQPDSLSHAVNEKVEPAKPDANLDDINPDVSGLKPSLDENPVPVAEPVSSAPIARLVEGTVMGTPVIGAKDLESMRRRAKASGNAAEPVETKASSTTKVEAVASSHKVETSSKADVPAGDAPSSPVLVSIEKAIDAVKPASYDVVYASNVDQYHKIQLPSAGKSWQDKMEALAIAANLRIEEIDGTLFVNKASQKTSFDESYASSPLNAATHPVTGGGESVSAMSEPETRGGIAEQSEVVVEPAQESENIDPLSLSPQQASPDALPEGTDFAHANVTPSTAKEPTVLARASDLSSSGLFGEKTNGNGSNSGLPEVEENASGMQYAEPARAPGSPPAPTLVEEAVAKAEPVSPSMSEAVGTVVTPASPSLDGADNGTIWIAERGETLHAVLSRWCERSGAQLVWSSQYDFPLQASITLEDSFEGAVRTILEAFANAAPRPVGRLHRQANLGMRVLIIQTRGNRYGE